MIKIGMMIGDRYEILEKIGTGGMSDVYKAKDHKLNRLVAVKVLKQEFSENENFVSKFRVEAQAAAGLMHPNIVNVYDVGEEAGVYYIVMELVEGITLKKYIEKKARLSYKEAVSIAIQVSLGIEAAHLNHIIHRDIKPQNIIISKDGKVKVTDFGIAKAASSNTITSNVMGSVHYTSPEQARGGYSDEKSDIYSLGITLYEMLTGRVPFNGETTVAIAIKHIQEPMPSPQDYVSEIPIGVSQIVLKCCQKSPDRRYQSMAELIEDLKEALHNPDTAFVNMPDPDTDGVTKTISDTDMHNIEHQSSLHDAETKVLAGSEVVQKKKHREIDVDDRDENTEGRSPLAERITTILIIVVGLLICGVIIFFVGKIFNELKNNGDNNPGTESSAVTESSVESSISKTEESMESSVVENLPIKMIDVSGLTLEIAKAQLRELGFSVTDPSEYVHSDTMPSGQVINASLKVDTEVPRGTEVTLIVSLGPEGKEVKVPNVVGYTQDEAESILSNVGLAMAVVKDYSDTVEAGKVISQNPGAKDTVEVGLTVTVHVSLGKENTKIAVPNLLGKTQEESATELSRVGLKLGDVTKEYSDTYAEGLVCSQNYSTGSYLDAGTAVNIVVSMGPKAVTYKYNDSIGAPTASEAPEYVAGSSVHVKINAGDKVIFESDVLAFPVSMNFTGLEAASGTVTFTYSYTVTTDPTEGTDEFGNPITIPGTSETKTESFTRTITFTEE